LSNALKFTPPEGTITLTTKLKKQKSPGTNDIQMFADVIVKDTGVGIAKEELDKVFNKYEQTEAGKDASLKGTGLGLAICREIVELHNGNVWVESVYHKGSSFGFSLPIQAVKIQNNP
jgi:signal transduction histidine kinase